MIKLAIKKWGIKLSSALPYWVDILKPCPDGDNTAVASSAPGTSKYGSIQSRLTTVV
jgi:hypothetical protein